MLKELFQYATDVETQSLKLPMLKFVMTEIQLQGMDVLLFVKLSQGIHALV